MDRRPTHPYVAHRSDSFAHDSTGRLFASDTPAMEMHSLLQTMRQDNDEGDANRPILSDQDAHNFTAETTDTGTDDGTGIGHRPATTSVSGSHYTSVSEHGTGAHAASGGGTWRGAIGRFRDRARTLMGGEPTLPDEVGMSTVTGTHHHASNLGAVSEAQVNRVDVKVFEDSWKESHTVPPKLQRAGLKNKAVPDIERWIEKFPQNLQFLTIRFDSEHETPIPESISRLTRLDQLELIFKQSGHDTQRAQTNEGTEPKWPHANRILDISVKNLLPLTSLTRLTIRNAPVETLPEQVTRIVNLVHLDLPGGKLVQLPFSDRVPHELVALSLRGQRNVRNLVGHLINSGAKICIELDQELKKDKKGNPPFTETNKGKKKRKPAISGGFSGLSLKEIVCAHEKPW